MTGRHAAATNDADPRRRLSDVDGAVHDGTADNGDAVAGDGAPADKIDSGGSRAGVRRRLRWPRSHPDAQSARRNGHAPAHARRRKHLLMLRIAMVRAAVLGGAAVIVLLGADGASTTTVTGQVVLTDAATANAGCQGQGSYADVRGGAPVTLRNASGRVLGTGSLSGGAPNPAASTCTYTFAIRTVPQDQAQYDLRAALRDQVVNTRADMFATHWTIGDSLGN